jgi:drug/metabolite transporter (DMT)-like permease
MALQTKHKAYLALAWTSLIWGSTWVVSKIGVQKIPALELSAVRQLIAGIIFLSFFLIKGQKLPTAKQFGWIIVMSFLMFVFANGLSTWSVAYIPSGLAALIAALYPLCVVILEFLFFKRPAQSGLTFIGLFLGVAGIAIVFYENAFHAQPEGYIFGVILAIVAMLAWSLGTIYVARNKYDMNPYYALGWQMIIGSIFIFLLAIVTNNFIPITEIPGDVWLILAYLIIMGSILAFIAFIYTMKHLPPAIASLYAYINPIVAIIIGSIVLKEKLTWHIIVGSIVTLIGVYLVNYSMKRIKQ